MYAQAEQIVIPKKEAGVTLPKYDHLFAPVLDALRALGGSASIAELNDSVIAKLVLSPDEIAMPHNNGRMTELEYRLSWARSYLKRFGLIDNPRRSVWALTPAGQEVGVVDNDQIVRYVRSHSRKKPAKVTANEIIEIREEELEESWRENVISILQTLQPDAFERLSQRLLRESGFTQVTVTGRSGDGGIDGTGIVQLGGLLSFPILFQCKRYKGSVGAGVIRDFRGAMIGRADRGLIITTGTFSRDAKLEATRDGAPLIDLVDGDQLLDKLKELSIGISTRTIEEVVVDRDFFDHV
jgi:restriction system protein